MQAAICFKFFVELRNCLLFGVVLQNLRGCMLSDLSRIIGTSAFLIWESKALPNDRFLLTLRFLCSLESIVTSNMSHYCNVVVWNV